MRKLVRSLTVLAVVAGFSLSLVGCGSTVANDPGSYTGTWWRNHMHKYMAVIKRDGRSFYQTFDRHIIDLDWDDPRID